MKPYTIARGLRRLASRIMDADALLSFNPEKMLRRAANKRIGRIIHHLTAGLFIKR